MLLSLLEDMISRQFLLSVAGRSADAITVASSRVEALRDCAEPRVSSGAPLSVNVELIWRICASSAIWRPAVSLACVPMTCEVDSLQSEEPLINGWIWLVCPPVGGDVLSSFDLTRVCSSYAALRVEVFRLTVG